MGTVPCAAEQPKEKLDLCPVEPRSHGHSGIEEMFFQQKDDVRVKSTSRVAANAKGFETPGGNRTMSQMWMLLEGP